VSDDPCAARVEADLQDPGFLAGVAAGRWRVIELKFPILYFAISAIEPDGKPSEYGFRAELSNFPAKDPMVQIWDHANDRVLPAGQRPKGDGRVNKTFQSWGPETVYRPWDRMTGPHNNNAATFPHLAWRPDRRLLFIFEDLHAILTSNARAPGVRACA
jgi:hypothetical protein